MKHTSPSNTSKEGVSIPYEIWYNKNLSAVESKLLGQVYILSQEAFGCIASNAHFTQITGTKERSITRLIKQLVEKEALNIIYHDGKNRKLSVNFEGLEKLSKQNEVDKLDNLSSLSTDIAQNVDLKIDNMSNIGKEGRQNNQLKVDNLSSMPSEARQKVLISHTICRHNIYSNNLKYNKRNKTKEKEDIKEKDQKTTTNSSLLSHPFRSDTTNARWNEWLTYRKKRGKPYKTDAAIKKVLTQLQEFHEDFIAELIDTSIANDWLRIVFPRTIDLYQEWLDRRRNLASPQTATGTKAKPKEDLIETTKQSDGVYKQLVALEKQRDTFETYPVHLLETIAAQLRDLWQRARKLGMFDSEIKRIEALGKKVKTLLDEKGGKA